MKLNKGTSIYVSNSLVKPEIYRYTTKVTNIITEVFPEMQEEYRGEQAVLSIQDFESLTFQDQMEVEAKIFDQYGDHADSNWELTKAQIEGEINIDEQQEINIQADRAEDEKTLGTLKDFPMSH